MNTHDLGLALNRPGGCADAGFVILNSYSSSPIKFQHSHSTFSFKGVDKITLNLIHISLRLDGIIVSRRHPKMRE